MVKIAVLVSGGGTNLQALMDAQDAGRAGPADIDHRRDLHRKARLCAGACQGTSGGIEPVRAFQR